jgi:hypothetical protein
MIADCIANYVRETGKISFTSRDIWSYQYSIDNIQAIFRKAEVDNANAESEYDKFFQQPMKLFAYSGVLTESKNGKENIFKVENLELLEFVSLRETYSLQFLICYIEKVLIDSELINTFNKFYTTPNKTNFDNIKEAFYQFTVANTPIGSRTSKIGAKSKPSYTECGRIFTKVINPLAFEHKTFGTEKGHLSRKKITYDMLMYNRDNFRDIYSEKPKEMTRKEYEVTIRFKPNAKYFAYMSVKAKNFIRVYNQQYRGGFTELLEPTELTIPATQIHHIFPESGFPIIAAYYENLIALTPNQHFISAHPQNKTSAIDTHYQYQCLIAKADRIKENIEKPNIETIYSFGKFIFIIRVGLDDEAYLQIEDGDYNGIKTKLAISYAA